MITVGDLKKMIKGLNNNVVVVLAVGESLEDICAVNTSVQWIKFDDTGEKELVLILPVCECDKASELQEGEINSQPDLN